MSKYTAEQLKSLSSGELVVLVLSMQDQLDRLNENFENLVEQLRISNSQRFGRKTERLQDIEGQLSLFNEIEAACDLNAPEPEPEELLPAARRKKKEKGKREEDLKDSKSIPLKSMSEPAASIRMNSSAPTGRKTSSGTAS